MQPLGSSFKIQDRQRRVIVNRLSGEKVELVGEVDRSRQYRGFVREGLNFCVGKAVTTVRLQILCEGVIPLRLVYEVIEKLT